METKLVVGGDTRERTRLGLEVLKNGDGVRELGDMNRNGGGSGELLSCLGTVIEDDF